MADLNYARRPEQNLRQGVFTTSIAVTKPVHRGANAMCDKCDEIDRRIERYRFILRNIQDKDFNDRTNELIAELQAQKAALHAE